MTKQKLQKMQQKVKTRKHNKNAYEQQQQEMQ
jgi:hypothetical protein